MVGIFSEPCLEFLHVVLGTSMNEAVPTCPILAYPNTLQIEGCQSIQCVIVLMFRCSMIPLQVWLKKEVREGEEGCSVLSKYLTSSFDVGAFVRKPDSVFVHPSKDTLCGGFVCLCSR